MIDPGMLVWGIRRQIDPVQIPTHGFIIRFDFRGLPKSNAAGAGNTATIIAALHDIVPTIGVVSFPELGAGGYLSDISTPVAASPIC